MLSPLHDTQRTRQIDVADLAQFRLSHTYEETLEKFHLTERQYYIRIKTQLFEYIYAELEYEAGQAVWRYNPPFWAIKAQSPVDILEQELFFIEEEYILKALDEKKRGERKGLPAGLYQNHSNIETLIAETFRRELNIPADFSRETVVEILQEEFLNPELGSPGNRLKAIGLANLPGKLGSSPFTVLTAYDLYLQRRHNFASLFDLGQEKHIHPWDATPQGYQQAYANIESRIAHTLEEKVPGLKCASRREAIKIIKEVIFHAEEGALAYLWNIGLASVTNARTIIKSNNSPMEIIQIYDGYVQRTRHSKSFFDLKQKYHLHPWEITTYGYWEQGNNVSVAIPHILEEAITGLKGASRDEAVCILEKRVLNNKGGAGHYLREIGLGPLIKVFHSRKKIHASTFSILSEYDAYRAKKDKAWISMFDNAQNHYLTVTDTNLGIERIVAIHHHAAA